MDRAPVSIHNATAKICADCAHFSDGLCLRSPKVDAVTGETGHFTAFAVRLGECGPDGKRFMLDPEVSKVERRFQLQQAIEKAIVDFSPDANEAGEIFAAITASLKRKYEDDYVADAADQAKAFEDALNELDMVPQ